MGPAGAGAGLNPTTVGANGPPPVRAPREIVAEVALAAAGVGMFEWDLSNGHLVWDHRTLEIFGYSDEEFTGTIEGFRQRLHPEDAERVEEALRRATDATGEFSEDYRIIVPSGAVRWVHARGRVVADAGPAGGGPGMLVGAVVDVTDQRSQETRLTQLVETMPTAFFSLDGDWRFGYVNSQAERLLGRSRDELVGSVVWDLFPDAVGSEFEANYREARVSGAATAFDAYYPPPLDTWFEVRAWPIGDGLGVYFTDVNARYRTAEAARRAAEVDRLLSEVARVLGAEDDRQLAEDLADSVLPHLGGDWGLVTVLGDGRPGFRRIAAAAAWHRDPGRRRLVEAFRAGIPHTEVPQETAFSRALNVGEIIVLGEEVRSVPDATAGTPQSTDALLELAPAAALLVPLRTGSGPIAHLTVFYDSGPVPPSAYELAEQLVEQSRELLERAYLSRRQHRFVEVLQRAMLTAPPSITGLQFAVRYSPAVSVGKVGGDWYDVVELRGGGALLVVGDVAGHDIEAAVTMGQILSVVRGLAAAVPVGPAELLAHADAAIGALRDPVLVTALCAHAVGPDDSGGFDVTFSNAGHPPPLLLSAQGEARVLWHRGNLLLGTGQATARTTFNCRLEAGETLVLFTDGLIERRDRPLTRGIEELRATLEQYPHEDLQTWCELVLDRMVDRGDLADDVAMLAVRCTG